MDRTRPASSRRVFAGALLAGCLALVLGGCVGTDFVEMAEDSLRRAFRYETPSAFLAKLL